MKSAKAQELQKSNSGRVFRKSESTLLTRRKIPVCVISMSSIHSDWLKQQVRLVRSIHAAATMHGGGYVSLWSFCRGTGMYPRQMGIRLTVSSCSVKVKTNTEQGETLGWSRRIVSLVHLHRDRSGLSMSNHLQPVATTQRTSCALDPSEVLGLLYFLF